MLVLLTAVRPQSAKSCLEATAASGSCSLGLGTLGIQPGAGAPSLAAQDHPVGTDLTASPRKVLAEGASSGCGD